MTTFGNTDLIKFKIVHAQRKLPYAELEFEKNKTVAEGDLVQLTGSLSINGSTLSSQTIFDGYIDDADQQELQKAKCKSRAEELKNRRPNQSTIHYICCILGGLIYRNCNYVNVPNTASTTDVVPDDDISNTNWKTAPLYEKIDEGYSATPDTNKISVDVVGNVADAIFSLTDHSLSSSYHYDIYQIDVMVYGYASGDSRKLQIILYKDDSTKSVGNPHSITLTFSNATWEWQTASWTNRFFNEDDINGLRVRIRKQDEEQIQIESIVVRCYYRYYTTIAKATNKITVAYNSDEVMLSILKGLVRMEEWTWYLRPNLDFYADNGNISTGVSITSSDKRAGVEGHKLTKAYDYVHIFGGIVAGARLEATSGTGNNPFKDTYNTIIEQTKLDTLADAIKNKVSNYPLEVKMERIVSADGFISVAQTVSVGSGITYFQSTRTIPTGTYNVEEIHYYGAKNTYQKTVLTLHSGLTFRDDVAKLPEQNSILIKQVNEATIHNDAAGEVDALTEKTALVSGDLFIIEDSEASYDKKKVKYGSFMEKQHIRVLAPIFLNTDDGYTSGANNVYFNGAVIAFGITSKANGRCIIGFILPPDYVAGTSFEIYFFLRVSGGGNPETIDYEIECNRMYDNAATSSEQTLNSTWSGDFSSQKIQVESLTFNGTNFNPGEMVRFDVRMEEDSNTHVTYVHGMYIKITVDERD